MGNLAAVWLEIPQVRPTPQTGWHVYSILASEGFGHTALGIALYAANFHVNGFARCPQLVQPQFVPATLFAPVDELNPGEISQMAVFASNDEPGWHSNRWWLATFVDVAGFVRTEGKSLQLEQVAAYRA